MLAFAEAEAIYNDLDKLFLYTNDQMNKFHLFIYFCTVPTEHNKNGICSTNDFVATNGQMGKILLTNIVFC